MKGIYTIFWLVVAIISFLLSISLYFKYSRDIRLYSTNIEAERSFSVLYNAIEDVCRGFVGEERQLTIYFSKYAKIEGKDKLICYENYNKKLCRKLTCFINAINISSSFILDDFFVNGLAKLKVTVKKYEYDHIKIIYKPFI